jgi:hypothetical protein
MTRRRQLVIWMAFLAMLAAGMIGIAAFNEFRRPPWIDNIRPGMSSSEFRDVLGDDAHCSYVSPSARHCLFLKDGYNIDSRLTREPASISLILVSVTVKPARESLLDRLRRWLGL